jgi:hypothetical protein
VEKYALKNHCKEITVETMGEQSKNSVGQEWLAIQENKAGNGFWFM